MAMDQELLEAIGQLMAAQEKRLDQKLAQQKDELLQAMDAKLDAQEKRFDQKLDAQEKRFDQKLSEQRRGIMQDAVTLMDAEFRPQFKLLSEELQLIKEALPSMDELDRVQQELNEHHSLLKLHTNAIQEIRRQLRRA